jgi:transposase
MSTVTHDTELDRLRAENARLEAERDAVAAERDAALAKVSKLEHKLDELLRQLYGRKSEKVNPAQILLGFAKDDEKEQAPLATPPHAGEAPDGEAAEEETKPVKKKKGHGWRKTPKDLPRKTTEIWPSEDELTCDRCGERRVSIGSPEITERYNFIPRSVFIEETVRHRCRCPRCQDGTAIAPLPPPPITGKTGHGRAEAGLLAQIAVAKFNDHLPLNRQSEIFEREGVYLSKSVLCDYVHGTATLLRPIAAAVLDDVLSRPVVGLDETGVRVVFATEDAKKETRNARIWVYRGLKGETYFKVSETKAKDDEAGPKIILALFEGFVQADAAGAFDDLYVDGKRLEVGCNCHARRKFYEARKSNPREAAFAIATWKRVYEIEARVREASPEERLAARQNEIKPILVAFDAWVDELAKSPALVPGTPLAIAVGYNRNHRVALRRFLDDPRLSPDNNAVERALRLVAVGRKNWLFAGSEASAHDAAILYTLVASCRELEVDVWQYLHDVIKRRAADPDAPVNELTPRVWWETRRAKPT